MSRARRHWPLVLALAFGVLLGYSLATFQVRAWQRDFFASLRPLRIVNPTYPLVHRLLAYEVPEATILPEYASLEHKVAALIEDAVGKRDIEEASVYYRDLETGRWVGINEEEAYHPASLLKVPLLIAYFRTRETDTQLFNKRLVYQATAARVDFEAASKLTPGKSYTIAELLERMIIESDNGAAYTLFDNINQDLLKSVYVRLGIEDPGDDSATYRIPTKVYALFFRTLYNGTYLSAGYSEEALEILTRSSYRNGLVSGVPDGTTVAHKFGEHITVENGVAVGEELHDCGIVYKPEHPYLLCVMTRANTGEAAASFISSISKLVYGSS